MTGISARFGFGAANVVPGKSGGDPTLADTLQDIADDLQGHQVALITAPDGIDAATTQTLANQLKARLNAVAPSKGSVFGTVQAPFDIEPAQTLTVAVDSGGADTVTFDAAAGVLDGSAGPYDMSQVVDLGLNIRWKLDRGDEIKTEFVAGDFSSPSAATAAEIATAMNADVSGTPVSDNAGSVRITSPTRGTKGRVDILGGNARLILGFTDTNKVADGTGDVADIDAVTVAEVKAVVEADSAGSEVQNVDDRLIIRTATVGSGGDIAVTGGTASAAMGLADTTVFAGSAGTPSKTFRS